MTTAVNFEAGGRRLGITALQKKVIFSGFVKKMQQVQLCVLFVLCSPSLTALDAAPPRGENLI